MQAEIDLLADFVRADASLLDVGCGSGRHLALLADRVRSGVGLDYQRDYLVLARRRIADPRVQFVVADAARMPFGAAFDAAICVTNSWGTMADKVGVLREMRRCAPKRGTRLVSVFAETSVAARVEWYARFGHVVVERADDHLLTDGGLHSEHFTEARLRSIVGDCEIHRLAGIGYAATW
jgi:ubiquinone/menaquinone biosynthesis C-methylase UbiE